MKRLLIAASICVAAIVTFMALSTAGADVSVSTTTLSSTTTSTTLDPAAVQKWNEAVWANAVAENERNAAQEAQAKAKAQAAAKAKQAQSQSQPTQRASSPGGLIPARLPCAIPEYICRRESNMTINAKNPNSTASGKYQFLDSTWNNYGGYRRAMDAPEEVQDAKARELWAGGRGCSHWSAC